jgi:hypothetical protein
MAKAKKKVKRENWRELWIDAANENLRKNELLDEIAEVVGLRRGECLLAGPEEAGIWEHRELPERVKRLKRERDHACESGVNRAVYEELERERDRLMEERDELRARLASEGLEVLKLKVESA